MRTETGEHRHWAGLCFAHLDAGRPIIIYWGDRAAITSSEGRPIGILHLEDIQRRLGSGAGGRRVVTANLRRG